MTNRYCEALDIDVPALDVVKDHSDANTYSLLIVALLERGAAMTLPEVAERFAEAGVAAAERALRSLKRCKPARAPIYRDGDRYALDPHDDELDLWAFRLGLRPPHAPRLSVVRPEPVPLPGPEQPLTTAELDEAWSDASLYSWSAQRIALAVLDAHGGAMQPDDVVTAVGARTRWHGLRLESGQFGRRGSAVRVGTDGRWEISERTAALLSTRRAVRERVEIARRRAAMAPDPVVIEASRQAAERRRAAHAAELARLRRALVHVFPATAPECAVIVDVNERRLETFSSKDLDAARERIRSFDVIGAVEVRAVLRAFELDAGERRLAEIGPPQKSMRLNKSGRTLKISTEMLVRGSCAIARPFADPSKLRGYLQRDQETRLRRRLEADAKSLHALYQYGRLHGAVRLRWGFLDEMIPAPWVHRDEPWLHDLKRAAAQSNGFVEVVTGSAPGWSEPWARARLCRVSEDESGYGLLLVDGEGWVIDDRDVQLARLPGSAD